MPINIWFSFSRRSFLPGELCFECSPLRSGTGPLSLAELRSSCGLGGTAPSGKKGQELEAIQNCVRMALSINPLENEALQHQRLSRRGNAAGSFMRSALSIRIIGTFILFLLGSCIVVSMNATLEKNKSVFQ